MTNMQEWKQLADAAAFKGEGYAVRFMAEKGNYNLTLGIGAEATFDNGKKWRDQVEYFVSDIEEFDPQTIVMLFKLNVKAHIERMERARIRAEQDD